MEKDEYIGRLRKALCRLPDSEREEVLADYEEHFMMGIAEGRTEREIADALGDPVSIGKEYAALFLVRKAESDPSARSLSRAVIATVGLGIFNLVVVFIPFIILVLLLALVGIIGFSLTCTGPFLAGYAALEIFGFFYSAFSSPPLARVFYGIGLTSSGLLLMVLTCWLGRICYLLGIRYLKWNIAVISGRESL